jgi:hypothetical protein
LHQASQDLKIQVERPLYLAMMGDRAHIQLLLCLEVHKTLVQIQVTITITVTWVTQRII